jgi:hypothetical protein
VRDREIRPVRTLDAYATRCHSEGMRYATVRKGDMVATSSGVRYIVTSEPGLALSGKLKVAARPASGKGPVRYLTVSGLTVIAPRP